MGKYGEDVNFLVLERMHTLPSAHLTHLLFLSSRKRWQKQNKEDHATNRLVLPELLNAAHGVPQSFPSMLLGTKLTKCPGVGTAAVTQHQHLHSLLTPAHFCTKYYKLDLPKS